VLENLMLFQPDNVYEQLMQEMELATRENPWRKDLSQSLVHVATTSTATGICTAPIDSIGVSL
jgi:hypothetical protein